MLLQNDEYLGKFCTLQLKFLEKLYISIPRLKGSWEIDNNKVGTVFWDTLYYTMLMNFSLKGWDHQNGKQGEGVHTVAIELIFY